MKNTQHKQRKHNSPPTESDLRLIGKQPTYIHTCLYNSTPLRSLQTTLASAMPVNGYHSFELRVQILTLHGLGYKNQDIATLLEVPVRTIQELIKKARTRGYNPEVSLRVKKEYIEDGKRSGRPSRPKEPTPVVEKSGHPEEPPKG